MPVGSARTGGGPPGLRRARENAAQGGAAPAAPTSPEEQRRQRFKNVASPKPSEADPASLSTCSRGKRPQQRLEKRSRKANPETDGMAEWGPVPPQPKPAKVTEHPRQASIRKSQQRPPIGIGAGTIQSRRRHRRRISVRGFPMLTRERDRATVRELAVSFGALADGKAQASLSPICLHQEASHPLGGAFGADLALPAAFTFAAALAEADSDARASSCRVRLRPPPPLPDLPSLAWGRRRA